LLRSSKEFFTEIFFWVCFTWLVNKATAKNNLPGRETAIGNRLREAREFLHYSQEDFADGVGIKRVRLASYETGRVPLRWDIALRICRRYQISEDWLATGGVKLKGWPRAPYLFSAGSRGVVFKASDAILETISPGIRFSAAWDSTLRAEYWKLLGQAARTWTRFDFSAADSVEMSNALEASVARWTSLIPDAERPRFYEGLIKCGMLLFVGLDRGSMPSSSAFKPAAKLPIEKAIESEVEKKGLQ
jgi:transcriptional regulator with XRE-family HTH domain